LSNRYSIQKIRPPLGPYPNSSMTSSTVIKSLISKKAYYRLMDVS
jgi:hypothetical protein